MEITSRYRSGIILVVGLVYFFLRFWDLTASCLWFDEIFSVHAAEHSWDTLFRFVALDIIHPPLFYVLLKVWILAGGESLFWLRFFPVFFSILAIVPFLLLCRELKLKFWTMAVALSLFAVNGSLIKYAQEVRMYSLFLFFLLVSMWLFSRFFNRGKNFWLLTLVNILLVYTHYFGWLVLLSEVIAILILQRIKIRRALLMFAITLACFLPWMFAVSSISDVNSDVKQNLGWIQRPGFKNIFELVFDVIEPFYFQQSSADPTSIFLITIPILILITFASILYLFLRENDDKNGSIYLLAVFSAVPILISFIASWLLPVSIWGSRHLIIVFAPTIILTAIFLVEIKIKAVGLVFILAIFALFGVALVIRINNEEPKNIWCAWENLARNLPIDAPRTVYVFEDLIAYHIWFATRNRGNVEVVKVNGMPEMSEDKAYFLPRGFTDVSVVTPEEIQGDRFWVAFRDSRWNEKRPPINFLLDRGHTIHSSKAVDVQQLQAIIVEVRK